MNWYLGNKKFFLFCQTFPELKPICISYFKNMILNVSSAIKARKFSKKNILSFVLYYTGVIPLIRFLQKLKSSDKLIILTYHRIADYNEDICTDLGIISATIDDFEKQIIYLQKHYNIINTQDLIDYIDRGKKLPQNAVLITFDDGYKDVYTYAYKILKKYNVSPIVFIPTDYIGSNKIFWWDEAAQRLRDKGVNLENIRRVLKDIGQLSEEKKDEFIRKIRNESKEVGRNLYKTRIVLNWDEINEMSQNGIEFGSHTCSHPILSKINLDSVEKEIVNSKRFIEEKIGKPVQIFCYPRGRSGDFNKTHYDILNKAGIKSAVCSIPGINKGNWENYKLKRISVDLNQTIYWFATRLCGLLL